MRRRRSRATGPIRPTDRIADVIARDERLIDVLAATAEPFERLRRPAMRRVMARLVTVEQAAGVAGVDASALVTRLNRALQAFGGEAKGASSAGAPGRDAQPNPKGGRNVEHATERPAAEEHRTAEAMPTELAAISEDRIVDLDVRPDLRARREPFRRIMETRRSLPPGGVLRLRAIFEPVPLYRVMARQGFAHWTERLGDEDWRVWFYPAPVQGHDGGSGSDTGPGVREGGGAPADNTEAGGAADGDDVVVLDVRGLEPPEPMVRTLEALERLPRGKTLVQLNVRVPRFLLPRLLERGFAYEVREQDEDLVRVFIRHADGGAGRVPDTDPDAGAG